MPIPLPQELASLASSFLSGSVWMAIVGSSAAMIWWRLTRGPRPFPTERTTRLRPPGRLRSYRVRAEAERRAEQLVRDLLEEAEFQQLIKRGYLEVRSPTFPGRVYLIPERQGPVTVCEQGKPVMRLCVQCLERVPDYDTVAMHKLMIEGNEREYLRVANRV
jgi:hypothetical protein